MKDCNFLRKSGPAAAVLLAGVLVLAAGCVGDRVTYVQPAYPVAVQAPEPVLPPPEVTPPPEVVELPPAPPPAPMAPMRSPVDLDRMLAPIALYPDPLLAQLLPAATLPAQVVLVDRYLREGGDMNLVDAQPWDNSLKALARYPATVRMLDDNLAWTTDLGLAFLNQPADVMDAVQRLRARARAVGNLQSTPQQTVVVYNGIIEIVPAAPQVIYVPVYQPEVVYVQPPPAPERLYISFGAGLVVGAWLNHDCDWHDHEVIVWHHDHPRPADWWYRPPARREAPTVVNNVTVVNNTTIVNKNFTVWRPQAHGAVADRGDRGWGQNDVRSTAPARNEPAKPAREDLRKPLVVAAQKPVTPQEVRSAPPVRETRPEARVNPPHEEVKPASASHEVHAVPPHNQAQPAPLPTQPSTAKPTVAKAPAPETTRPSTGQQASPREAMPTPRANQPIAAPKDPRQVTTSVPAKQPSVTSSPKPAVSPTTSHPVAHAPVHAQSGALTGIENPGVTREASVRGQQSREAIAKPAAAHNPASKPMPSPKEKENPADTKKPQKGHENEK